MTWACGYDDFLPDFSRNYIGVNSILPEKLSYDRLAMMMDCQEMLAAETLQPAVFLDRDGVLIQDVDLLVHPSQAQLTHGAAWAVKALKTAGYQVIVVSNQTVVARGLATEKDVVIVHDAVQHLLIAADGLPADAFYFCPHHPKATLAQYRVACQCRKPRPGLLTRAAAERGIDLAHSYMVGDRITDVVAGQRAGCKTILIKSGKHMDPPIESPDPIDPTCRPDLVCADLVQAAMIILENHS